MDEKIAKNALDALAKMYGYERCAIGELEDFLQKSSFISTVNFASGVLGYGYYRSSYIIADDISIVARSYTEALCILLKNVVLNKVVVAADDKTIEFDDVMKTLDAIDKKNLDVLKFDCSLLGIDIDEVMSKYG